MRTLAFVFALAVLVAACGGDGAPAAAPAASPTAGVRVTVPPRPAEFEDYAEVIAAYLTQAGDAAIGEPCLAELFAAWQMPSGDEGQLAPSEPPRGARCLVGNTDGDPEAEVAVSLSFWLAETPAFDLSMLTKVAILDRVDGVYRVVYETQLAEKPEPSLAPAVLVAAEDLTADGAGELVYTTTFCGAHTCFLTVNVLSGDATGYRALTPSDPPGQSAVRVASADLRVEDTDGNATKELVLYGGLIGSAGAGVQRAATFTYAWNGETFSLASTVYEPSDLRYFKVRDADDAFARGDYEEAAALYDEAATSDELQEVEFFGSREELRAYALFRRGLSGLQLGDANAASRAIEQAIASYPISLYGQAAVLFRNAGNLSQAGSSGDLSEGCRAVTDFARENAERLQEIWDYGYANPQPAPEDVCPF
jgi:tetratricopeptide (TPR) repeat protein